MLHQVIWASLFVVGFLACAIDGAADSHNIIETIAFVDSKALADWLSVGTGNTQEGLKKFVEGIFEGTNAIFRELERDGIRVELRIKSIEPVSDQILTVLEDNKVNETDSLPDFKKWLTAKKSTFGTADHFVLFTGHDLGVFGTANDGNGTAGYAYIGQMCTEHSLSIVEASFSGSAVLVFAHEIGHILNSKHDGKENTCPSNSPYVMGAKQSQLLTELGFRFSSCSKIQMKDYLNDPNKDFACLTSDNPVPAVNGKHIGELYDPDTLCKITQGLDDSYMNRNIAYPGVCKRIECWNKDKQKYMHVSGTDGFPCGSSKRCSLGYCVPSATVESSVSDTCVFGDSPSHAILTYKRNETYSTYHTCQGLQASGQTWHCYDDYGKTRCCASCAAAETTNSDCLYGDKEEWCSSLELPYGCNWNDKVCCATCDALAREINGTDGCKYGDKQKWCNQMTSPEHCDAGSGTNREYCCKTCAELRKK